MKALELDPDLAEARAALAYIKFRIDWDWDGAEKEFKKAIALKPGMLPLMNGMRYTWQSRAGLTRL